MDTPTAEQKIRIKAAANEWTSKNLPVVRRLIIHSTPVYDADFQAWTVGLTAKSHDGSQVTVGNLVIDSHACIVDSYSPAQRRCKRKYLAPRATGATNRARNAPRG